MKAREIKFLKVNIEQIINLIRLVNINKEAIDTHTSMLTTVRTKLDKYQKEYQDKEYMKTISPAEQKCILDNAQALYETYQILSKEIEYLDLSKQPLFVTNAIKDLEQAYLLIEWFLETEGEPGDILIPHLTSLRPNTFEKGKYKNQIDSLYSEMEAQSHDFYVDHAEPPKDLNTFIAQPIVLAISSSLILSSMWLQKEKERLLTEAIPETRVIKLPEEILPEVPTGPEEKE